MVEFYFNKFENQSIVYTLFKHYNIAIS